MGITGVHPRQVGGEERRLVAAGAGADLDDHVFVVAGVAGEHAHADLFAELIERMPALKQFLLRELPHLRVGRSVAEEAFGVGDRTFRRPHAARQLVDLLELGMLARHIRVPRAVTQGLRVGELGVELLVGALDLFDEVVESGHGQSLRHDLHALLQRPILRLKLDDLLQSRDGDLDLGAVRPLRGHVLQRQPGGHDEPDDGA